MAETVGIKLANGDFYPIFEGEFPVKKRLVLTTVHDRQNSVQIDLFRSTLKSMMDAQYIGSLVIENIKPRSKGEPSIEMLISLDDGGNIHADAYIPNDPESGEHHILNVSLKTMDAPEKTIEFPDFDIEDASLSSLKTPKTSFNKKTEKNEEKKFPWLIMICATLFVIIAIAVIWFFFLGGAELFSSNEKESAFFGQAEITEPEIREPFLEQDFYQDIIEDLTDDFEEGFTEEYPMDFSFEEIIADDVPVIQSRAAEPVETVAAPPRRDRPPAPVLSYRVPAVIPREGTRYMVRWGDTLWDISQAFYRNPWLYTEIARANNISNPDHIVTGFWVRIPYIP